MMQAGLKIQRVWLFYRCLYKQTKILFCFECELFRVQPCWLALYKSNFKKIYKKMAHDVFATYASIVYKMTSLIQTAGNKLAALMAMSLQLLQMIINTQDMKMR